MNEHRRKIVARRLGKALLSALSICAIAAPAHADPVFPFTNLVIDHLVYSAKDTVVFDSLASSDYQGEPQQTSTQLNVFEGRFLTWRMAGEFVGMCNAQGTSSAVAIVYVPSGTKSAPINCDGVEAGVFGPARRTLAGTYQSTTSISGNIVEFTGLFTGRSQFYSPPSDAVPTFDDFGTVRQHGKFQITQAGCKVLLYETESNVREDYNDSDNGYHTVKDKSWVERTSPATVCQLK